MTLEEWKLKNGVASELDPVEMQIKAKVIADRKLDGEDYCVLCAEGPMPIRDMRIITREEDPYIQLEEEGMKVRACQKCFDNTYPK